jgi:CBS domain-containing protein
MSIQNILDRKGADVFTIDPTATIRTAAYLMRARGIAALVVKSGDVVASYRNVDFKRRVTLWLTDPRLFKERPADARSRSPEGRERLRPNDPER